MNSHERRTQKRKTANSASGKNATGPASTRQEKRIEGQSPQAPPSPIQRGASRVVKFLGRLWSLILVALALVGYYAVVKPHVSVDPQVTLNPVDPFTTEFVVTNDSSAFSIRQLEFTCWSPSTKTSHNIQIWSPVAQEKRTGIIQDIGPKEKGTIECPSLTGGIGTFLGDVTSSQLVIIFSYKQNFWPFKQEERHPFKAERDSQGGQRWFPVTPDQEENSSPPMPHSN